MEVSNFINLLKSFCSLIAVIPIGQFEQYLESASALVNDYTHAARSLSSNERKTLNSFSTF